MSDEAYKLKQGQKEYSNYFNAVKVAKAKAEEQDEPVTVCKKELKDFNPVVRIHPDGQEEKINN